MAEVKKIAVIAGDGIGPEVVAEAEKVIETYGGSVRLYDLKRSMRCSAESPLMRKERHCRRRHWKYVEVQMLYCLEP